MPSIRAESHQQAEQFFDSTVDHYVRRSSGAVSNFSSLIFQRRIAIVESLIRRLAVSGGKALDYGMGPAVFAKCTTVSGMHYLGVDLSSEMVERSKLLGLPNTEYVVGDLEALNAYQGQKDLVLAIGLLDYLEDVPQGISQLAACVKPGGHLVLSFRNRYSLPGLMRDASKAILRPFVTGSSGPHGKAFFAKVHEKSMDLDGQLIPHLKSLGFASFDAQYFNCSPLFFNFPMPKFLWRAWYAADQAIARPITRFLCSGGVVVATKRPR